MDFSFHVIKTASHHTLILVCGSAESLRFKFWAESYIRVWWIKAHGACHIKCWGLSVLPTAIWLTAIIEPNPSVDYHNRTAPPFSVHLSLQVLAKQTTNTPRTRKREKRYCHHGDKMPLKAMTLCHVKRVFKCSFVRLSLSPHANRQLLKTKRIQRKSFQMCLPLGYHSRCFSQRERKNARTLT